MFRALVLGLLGLTLAACVSAPPAPDTPIRAFYLSQSVGFVHETVRRPDDGVSASGLAPSEIALQQMGRNGGFTVDLTQDARDLTPERLNEIDVLVVSTTGALPIDRVSWDALVARVESGRLGVVGVHSAADTQLDFEGGREAWPRFLGGQFDGHPWLEATAIRLTNLEPSHPLASMWPHGTDYAEEIYQYAGFDPGSVRVLQSLDMSAGPLRRPYPVPVTWVKRIGQGRLFYTNLGHTPSTWDDPRFRDQIIAAIHWTAGRSSDLPDTPNPDRQEADAVDAFLAAEGLPATASVDTGAADDIRALQNLHPEKHDGDATAYDAARAAIRSRLGY
ncbi:ThuA domain-containing protein [Brevundimonas sp.]|uniref:ThuA domain-containing protein n=1 Tax=Brevundimonas sp. TaxID=1871086 RepID=UPI0035B43A86